MRTVALIDYGSGNLPSAQKALVSAAAALDGDWSIHATSDPEWVRSADHVVLPGVGAFKSCMTALKAREGLIEALTHAVKIRGAPFLGVCVGMQLLADRGLEFGETQGLGWISGKVCKLQPAQPDAKVPHMGWNTLEPVRRHPLLDRMPAGTHMYFTHSFEFLPSDPADIAAVSDHGGQLTAMVIRDNVVGVQFHPEKSQTAGIELIQRFLGWRP